MSPSRFLKMSTVGLLSLVSTIDIYAEEYERWDLMNSVVPGTEYLSYKLSYSGIFTLFTWAELADTAIYVQPDRKSFEGHNSCQTIMKLSTENYPIAETFHPVRYQWISTSSPDLKRTYLVEVIDKGKNDSHEVVWLDWSNRQFELYRKRELKPSNKNYWGNNDYDYWNSEQQVEYVWEKDGKKSLPVFLSHYPELEGGRSYLIHRKSANGLDIEHAVDPLGMVYLIRQHDFHGNDDLVIDVTVDDELKKYRARSLGIETINIGDRKISTRKVEVMLADKAKADEEGWLKLWLTEDQAGIPVRFQVDATAGKMKIEITEQSLSENIEKGSRGGCLDFGTHNMDSFRAGIARGTAK
jgi:hypothetical protein